MQQDESIKLRDYTKSLLSALKLQQLSINQSFNESSSNSAAKQFDSIQLNSVISNINSFKTTISNAAASPTSASFNQKCVSFSESLVACPTRRRAKSVPPKLINKKSTKVKTKVSTSRKGATSARPRSILKKSFDNTTDTDSMDEETKTLYDEVNEFYLKNYKYSIDLKEINKNDKRSVIDCLTKIRQRYLNHAYNDSNDSKIDFEEFKKKRERAKLQTSKNSTKTPVGKNNRKVSADDDLKSYSDSEENKKAVRKKRSTFSIKNIPKNNRTLLGYDWIKDALENGNNVSFNQSESYWNDLISFRDQNKNDCVSRDTFNDTSYFYENDLTLPDDDPDNLRHKCIHTYTINERLFPVPTYVGDNGESICPVCKSSRKEPTSYAPQFCKVSIPQSRLQSQVTIQPQKRSQYQREDTLSLSEHCVAGYECSNENTAMKFPRAKNVDLKSATGRPSDLIKFTIADMKKIAANKDPTASLYNKGHAMRFELEDQHQKRLRELVPKFKIK